MLCAGSGLTLAADFETLFFTSFEEEDLLQNRAGAWSALQIQDPCFVKDCLTNKRPSVVELTKAKAVSGKQALRCFTDGGDSHFVAKADAYTTNVRLDIGNTYKISAWYWFPSDTFIKTVTIMDLECSTCSKSAGPRLWVDGRRNTGPATFTFGRGKLGLPNKKSRVPVPVGQWFKLTVLITFGVGDKGRTQVFIDSGPAKTVQVIDFVGTNIQPDTIADLDHYDFLQFGITANATGTKPNGQYTAFTLYVDDVKIEHQINGSVAPLPPSNLTIQ